MSEPVVSIIIPAYNAESTVAGAIESALAQDGVALQILAVDDGSKDGTWEEIQKFSARSEVLCLQHPEGSNRGVSASRQLGVSHADGEFVAFLDADDLCLPGRLARQAAALKSRPDAVLCHGRVDVVSEHAGEERWVESNFRWTPHENPWFPLLEPGFFRTNPICASTVCARRQNLIQIPFGADFVFQFEDWMLWLLLAEAGPFLFLDEPLVRYRYHPDSFTARMKAKPAIGQLAHLEMLAALSTRARTQELTERALSELAAACERLIVTYRAKSTDGAPPKLPNSDDRVRQLEIELERTDRRLQQITRSRSFRILAALRRLSTPG